jgi:phenylpyruvate tautomerase PptA (4-oxalocrotonate tautomerase family)
MPFHWQLAEAGDGNVNRRRSLIEGITNVMSFHVSEAQNSIWTVG